MQDRMPVLREEKKRPRSSRKLRMFLFLLFVVLLAVLFFRSSLSEVSLLEVTGNEVLTQDEIKEAAGIVPGDNFFAFRSSQVEARIRELKAIDAVEVRRSFPGLLRIKVDEHPTVAFQLTAEGSKQALLANGLAVPVQDAGLMIDKPILSGWDDADPIKAKLCETLGKISDKLLAEISEIRPSPTTTYEDKIKLYTRSQYEVYTTVSYLPDRLPYLEEMIEQMMDKKIESGVFELLEVNTHIPFEMYYEKRPAEKSGE